MVGRQRAALWEPTPIRDAVAGVSFGSLVSADSQALGGKGELMT
jgi:hypothetical protein